MSKLVIYTQYCENYSDTDTPRWKGKGGETYVLPNLTFEQLNKIKDVQGVIADSIEYFGEMTMEYVIGWSVEEDEAKVCPEWETPWTIVEENGEYMIERFVKASEWWSGDYAGKFEKRPIGMGSTFDPDQVVVEYMEKETA